MNKTRINFGVILALLVVVAALSVLLVILSSCAPAVDSAPYAKETTLTTVNEVPWIGRYVDERYDVVCFVTDNALSCVPENVLK